MRKITKRSAAVVAGSVLALTGATAAFAYANGWFSGSGTATATASTIQTVTATISTTGNIYPGKELPITGTVNNPNDYQVQIDSITVDTVQTGIGACNAASGLAFTELPSGLKINPGSYPGVGLGKLTMNQSADPSCSGATFTITAKMTGEISS